MKKQLLITLIFALCTVAFSQHYLDLDDYTEAQNFLDDYEHEALQDYAYALYADTQGLGALGKLVKGGANLAKSLTSILSDLAAKTKSLWKSKLASFKAMWAKGAKPSKSQLKKDLENARDGILELMKGEAEAALGDSFFNLDVCYKKAFGRGVGQVLTECKSGEKSGLLCYPKCKSGYTGILVVFIIILY